VDGKRGEQKKYGIKRYKWGKQYKSEGHSRILRWNISVVYFQWLIEVQMLV
jgi:hypothetical protein